MEKLIYIICNEYTISTYIQLNPCWAHKIAIQSIDNSTQYTDRQTDTFGRNDAIVIFSKWETNPNTSTATKTTKMRTSSFKLNNAEKMNKSVISGCYPYRKIAQMLFEEIQNKGENKKTCYVFYVTW